MIRLSEPEPKERRAYGATHSFRLSPQAHILVEDIRRPRRRGGKSAAVSEAIVAYFSPRTARRSDGFSNAVYSKGEMPSYQELQENIAALQNVITRLHTDLDALKKVENDAPTPGWGHRLLARFGFRI